MRVRMLVLAVLLVGVACDGEPESVPADPVRPDPVAGELPCDEVIGAGAAIPRSYETILDVVALPTASSARRARQAYADESAAAPSYFGKTGLLVLAGEAFTVAVTQPGTGTIGWGAPADFAPSVSTEGCPGDGWIVFPGGFQVNAPTCLELTVTAHGDQESVQIGVGAACEGQLPPPQV